MILNLKRKIFPGFILSLFFIFLFYNFAFAGVDRTQNLGGLSNTGSEIGYESADKGKSPDRIAVIVGDGIKVVLSLLGVIFMILVFMGGFDIVSSNGNEELVKKGKGRIKDGMIGMLAILLAYTITYLAVQWVTQGGALLKDI